LRMHSGSYNRNPSAKIVRLTIRKNMLLNLKSCLHSGNCMLDNDVPLMSGDSLLEESAALNASLVCNEENMDDNDSFDDNIEMDNIEELPTSTCSLESAKGSIDFGNLHVSNREFSDSFRIINFDKYYSQLRSKAFTLDKLFSMISRSVEEKYPNWFIQDECAAHRKDL
ncbi:unnamed protein product, partial [Heterotrigona itama]